MWKILPDTHEALSRLEWRLWLVAAVVTLVGLLLGVAAREVGRQKASNLQRCLDDAVRQRDEKAAALERKTGELEVRQATQAPRRLTPAQHTEFIELLSPKPAHAARVMVAAVPGDAETAHFAIDLLIALREAGWDAYVYQAPLPNIGVGITMTFNSDPEKAIGGPLLLAALNKVGVPAEGGQTEGSEPGTIRLSVGPKPD
jgi:hypothetical protein